MIEELWQATLDPHSPRHDSWFRILESEKVPLTSPASFETQLGPEKAEVYRIDVPALTSEQRRRLIEFIGSTFGPKLGDILDELGKNGFPIRASDVIMSFSLRAFL